MTGILGSGFGIYGYLPAILLIEDFVVLLTKSKENFYLRKELLPFAGRVIFIDDLDVFLQTITTLIISIPPIEQYKIVDKVLKYDNISWLFLEKPMSFDPQSAFMLKKSLDKSQKKYALCYSFLYTDWFREMNNIVSAKNQKTVFHLNVKWFFKAHHYKNNLNNWKRNVSVGGGVIRFYGIHLIAVLVSLGFSNIIYSETTGYSENDLFLWEAEFSNPISGSTLKLFVNTDCQKDFFEVSIKNKISDAEEESENLITQTSPFGSNHHIENGIDSRTLVLKEYISDTYERTDSVISSIFYDQVNSLWSYIESRSHFNYSLLE